MIVVRTELHYSSKRVPTGFTLIEVLVVVAVIALLLAILIPSLKAARAQARMAVCGSNIRQLAFANIGYATENKGYFVLAAEDIGVGFGGTKRWHGIRESAGVSPDPDLNQFDPARGLLVRYLGRDGQVKKCPSFRDYTDDNPRVDAFEAACGGYGYNQSYIGGRYDLYVGNDAARHSARINDVRQPAATVMFTDAAFAQLPNEPPLEVYVIEYSFCEPPLFQLAPGEPSPFRPTPSIHFRHRDQTSVAWADGHVDAHRLTLSSGLPKMLGLPIGWFGRSDNTLFDLK